MKKRLTIGGLIAAMSLVPISIANAETFETVSPTNNNPSGSYLIASPFRAEISPAHQRRHSLMEMLVLQMEMSELAEEAMESEDPEIQALAKEMLDASNEMSNKVLELIQRSPRSGQFKP